ncbi:hypothetical protein SGFS_005760 [Streptomyces graminofaciens]|uniref:Secreted protein n=1 Tax=Streptomyces graminofaciens TaxID=68212 RepID=A0ABM7F0P1_9ACTN|nr:hypothetical protein SGFS_005760 [Streptomyces graminofaciens]
MLVLLVASATFVLSCVSGPPADGAAGGTSLVHTVAAAAQHLDRDPCEEHPGGHDCHSPDPRAVLGHTPSLGTDRATIPWLHAASEAGASLGPSREPGRARPPDLHELQLLRV